MFVVTPWAAYLTPSRMQFSAHDCLVVQRVELGIVLGETQELLVLVLPLSWIGWKNASRTREVSCVVQPWVVVHLAVRSLGWISGIRPICCVVARLARAIVVNSRE